MGCGKSTLGRRLARRLGAEFADTDALIERREGASVADVFRYEGEEHVSREAEREVLEQTLAGNRRRGLHGRRSSRLARQHWPA